MTWFLLMALYWSDDLEGSIDGWWWLLLRLLFVRFSILLL
jgi:hypothetical protein